MTCCSYENSSAKRKLLGIAALVVLIATLGKGVGCGLAALLVASPLFELVYGQYHQQRRSDLCIFSRY
ncbi:MAG: hypothetical protein JO202_16340 [Ktedonobacteraceae bacterium]|nr:hypothetical protein [Ktedonobacteraceae bacterium]